jgi:hypothetical protein
MVVVVENDRAVVLDAPKKAVPNGTVAGVQLVPVLKSPLGVPFPIQVAFCAAAGAISAEEASSVASSARVGTRAIHRPRRKAAPASEHVKIAPRRVPAPARPFHPQVVI